jgi:hypothetical protein
MTAGIRRRVSRNPGGLLVVARWALPALLLWTWGCGNDEVSTPRLPGIPELPARGFYMGVLPTPAEGQEFSEAYAQAARVADFAPVWGRPTPFYEMPAELAGDWGRLFVQRYIRGNGMFPLIHLSFMDEDLTLMVPPGMEQASLADSSWREAYRQAALGVVAIAGPCYLSLGNEVNRWYETYGTEPGNPNGFQHFVSLYEEIYDQVKALSPETIVFCTFAREIVSENREADLDVLGLFDPEKMDLLVWTTYPYAVRGINRPEDLPGDYYSRAASRMPGKPVGFSEAGWPSLEAFGGEVAQAEFLQALTDRLTVSRGIELRLLGWPWLHDLGDEGLGLIRKEGAEKKVFEVWTELYRSAVPVAGRGERP